MMVRMMMVTMVKMMVMVMIVKMIIIMMWIWWDGDDDLDHDGYDDDDGLDGEDDDDNGHDGKADHEGHDSENDDDDDDQDGRMWSFTSHGTMKTPPCSFFSYFPDTQVATLNKSVPLLWDGIPLQFHSESHFSISWPSRRQPAAVDPPINSLPSNFEMIPLVQALQVKELLSRALGWRGVGTVVFLPTRCCYSSTSDFGLIFFLLFFN